MCLAVSFRKKRLSQENEYKTTYTVDSIVDETVSSTLF